MGKIAQNYLVFFQVGICPLQFQYIRVWDVWGGRGGVGRDINIPVTGPSPRHTEWHCG